MKLAFVLTIAVCVVAVTQAAPQLNLLNQAYLALGNALYGLTSALNQVGLLLINVGNTAGSAVQTLLNTVAANIRDVIGAALNIVAGLATLPQTTLNTVNALLTNATNLITSALAGAGTNVNSMAPVLANIQSILTSTANNLASLNASALTPLQTSLSQVAASLGNTVGQIAG